MPLMLSRVRAAMELAPRVEPRVRAGTDGTVVIPSRIAAMCGGQMTCISSQHGESSRIESAIAAKRLRPATQQRCPGSSSESSRIGPGKQHMY
jgi:hypothetical protein